MNKLKFIIFIIISTPLSLLSQNSAEEFAQSQIPPSPEAAGLGKYGDVPVSTFTGNPGVNIPVYTIQYRGMSVPITLGYNSNGIKVSEEASWVGLGWNLSAGGMITRTIRGADDFDQSIAHNYANTDSSDPSGPDLNAWGGNDFIGSGIGSQATLSVFDSQPLDDSCLFENGSFDKSLLCPIEERDMEPDLYSFNFNGYSGKFLMDRGGNFVPIEAQDIEIIMTYDGSVNPTFTIKTNDGYSYDFGKSDSGRQKTYSRSFTNTIIEGSSSLSSSDNSYISTWFLEKITSPNGYVINFVYDKDDVNRIIPVPGYSESSEVILNEVTIGGSSPNCPIPDLEEQMLYETATVISYPAVYLSEINYEYGKVDFKTGDRDDLVNGKRLEWIEIYHNTNTNSTPVKKFNFSYDYFSSNTFDYLTNDNNRWEKKFTTPLTTFRGDSYNLSQELNEKRLKLISFGDHGNLDNTATSEIPPHKFFYDETGNIPAKTSLCIDHWGYSNGASNNTSLIPSWTNNTSINYNLANSVDGANREFNEVLAKKWLINKVEYPTGGHSALIYEANTYPVTKSIEIPTRVADTLEEKTDESNCTPLTIPSSEILDFSQFTSLSARVEFVFVLELNKTYCGDENNQNCNTVFLDNTLKSDPVGYEIKLVDDNNNIIKTWNHTVFVDETGGNDTYYTYRLTDEIVLNLSTGYELQYNPTTCTNQAPANLLSFSSEAIAGKSVIVNLEAEPAAGLRVSKATDYSSDNTVANTKRYKYQSLNPGNPSSGKLISEPKYHRLKTFEKDALGGCQTFAGIRGL